MIRLTTDGRSLPSSLLARTAYDITVSIDGSVPIFVEWELLSGLTVVASGQGANFRLVPPAPGVFTLDVKALKSTGHGEESIFTLPVSSRRTVAPVLSVKWSRLQVAQGSSVSAVLNYHDPEGTTATNLYWALYWNSNQISNGNSPRIDIPAAQHGVYRIVASATDSTGATVLADSSIRVGGAYEVLPAIVPPHDNTTFQYLGCLYSDTFTTAAGTASYLPFDVATFLQETVLLPGTTHVRFILDDDVSVDDEVVIRTNTGNWAVVGPPSGLSTETLVYDYSLDRPYISAPADRRLAYTVDVWNVHSYPISASTFRIKVECYYAADAIFEYSRCSYSEFSGGAGQRQRRLIAVVENMAVDLDAVFARGRGGADSTIVYTTQLPDRIYTIASAQGTPYPQLPATGAFYTEANIVSFYDPPAHTGLPVLQASGVYGMSGLRPYTFTLTTPAEYPVVQRVRRAYGRMGIYMAAGGVNADATITARIKTNNGLVDYTVPLADFYNPEVDTFEKIGEVDIDVSDYGFDIGGLAIYLKINE